MDEESTGGAEPGRGGDPGLRAHALGLIVNVFLTVAKFVVGWIAGSAALTADGFNSAGDIFATLVGFAGYTYARKPPDEDHHYGHGNAESIAGLIIGAVLAATGIFIAIEGGLSLLDPKVAPPDTLALWVAGVTVVSKELLYRYVSRVGRALRSPSLLASARDHRGDVLVGITVFVGVLAAQFDMPALDPLTALGIGVYIAVYAIPPIRDNVGILMDRSPPEMRARVAEVVAREPEIRGFSRIRVIPVGTQFVVDLAILIDEEQTIREGHALAHRVQDRIAEAIEGIEAVHVHVEPAT